MGRSCIVGLLALVVFIGCIGVSIYWLLGRVSSMDKGMIRVIAPGTSTFQIEKPSTYTIYYEYKGVIDGKVFTSNANLGDITIVVSSSAGDILPIEPLNISSTYDLGNRSGIGIYTFNASAPGEYTITSTYDEGVDYGRFILAIGTDFTQSILISVFGMLGILFGAFILAGLLVLLAIYIHPSVRRAFSGSKSAML